jgi:hypothetical protein
MPPNATTLRVQLQGTAAGVIEFAAIRVVQGTAVPEWR